MAPLQARAARYRFGLDLLLPNGRHLQQWPLEKEDFGRAIEATFFEGLRRGVFAEYRFSIDSARIEPCFVEPGRPDVNGFEVVLPSESGEQRQKFGADFFEGLALQLGARLARAGQLPSEGVLAYRLLGYEEEPPAARVGGLKLELESESDPLPIGTGSRKAMGPTEVWDEIRPTDFPVVIPRHVLEEGVEEAGNNPEREVGGVLLGHLRRDSGTHDLYLEVTCFVPGEETRATGVSVTFTHATWARVREVVQWRGQGELIVGWVHSHPFRLCAECPLPVRPECQRKVLFYSREDEFLMTLSFPRPFMVGLLTAVEPRLVGALGHLPVKLFGWRNGRIEARGFEVVDEGGA